MHMPKFHRGLLLMLAVLCLAGLGAPPHARATDQSESFKQKLREPFKGDFDAIAERGYLRVLVPFSKTFYFIDGGVQRGTTVDLMAEFAKFAQKRHGKAIGNAYIAFIPTPRDRLFPDLAEGRGDIALGNLTITDARRELADFSDPLFTPVLEVPVTREDADDMTSPEALSGKTVHVRTSSSYYESLQALNERLKSGGRPPVNIIAADEALEDEDLLDLVLAGGIDMIIMDGHKADFWLGIREGFKTHPEAAVRTDGETAIALRKDTPKLRAELNAFVKTVRKGTLLGNIILKKYLKETKYLEQLDDEARLQRFKDIADLFRKYGAEFSVDWLLVAAQSFQESKFDQSVRSRAGAVGLMQIKPSTAADKNVGIKGVAEDPDKNVHAGVKYLRFIADTYFADLKDDPANQTFFALAAYNAGPSRFDRLRRKAAEMGYDPDKWFGNVEWVVGADISREPVRYVGNIFKYYVVFGEEDKRRQAGAAKAE